MALTIAEVMRAMPAAFVPEKAAGVTARVQFDFTSDGGGQYALNIHDGVCDLIEGVAPDARTTVIAAAADYLDIAEGRLEAMKAFVGGKLKLKGDMMFAMKFLQMFDPKRVSQ